MKLVQGVERHKPAVIKQVSPGGVTQHGDCAHNTISCTGKLLREQISEQLSPQEEKGFVTVHGKDIN